MRNGTSVLSCVMTDGGLAGLQLYQVTFEIIWRVSVPRLQWAQCDGAVSGFDWMFVVVASFTWPCIPQAMRPT
jgi:hypothetical protein